MPYSCPGIDIIYIHILSHNRYILFLLSTDSCNGPERAISSKDIIDIFHHSLAHHVGTTQHYLNLVHYAYILLALFSNLLIPRSYLVLSCISFLMKSLGRDLHFLLTI